MCHPQNQESEQGPLKATSPDTQGTERERPTSESRPAASHRRLSVRPGVVSTSREGPLARGEPPGSGLINTAHEVLATEHAPTCQTPLRRSPPVREILPVPTLPDRAESDELLFLTS